MMPALFIREGREVEELKDKTSIDPPPRTTLPCGRVINPTLNQCCQSECPGKSFREIDRCYQACKDNGPEAAAKFAKPRRTCKTRAEVENLLASGISDPWEIASRLNLGVNAIYRHLAEIRQAALGG